MHDDEAPLIEEWKQLSVDFEETMEVEFRDDEDVLDVIHDGEL